MSEVIEVQRVPEKFEALRWFGDNTEAVMEFVPGSEYVQEIQYTHPIKGDVLIPEHIWVGGGAQIKSLQVGDWVIKPETSRAFPLIDEEYNQMFEEVTP